MTRTRQNQALMIQDQLKPDRTKAKPEKLTKQNPIIQLHPTLLERFKHRISTARREKGRGAALLPSN